MSAETHAASRPLLRSLYLMASMVEARDAYTGGHLWRVSQFSGLLAGDLQLGDAEVARITLGGFLHDLGKIGVPDAILNKADRLSDAEYAVIQTHPEIGARLLSGHPLSPLVHAAVALHHERPDGQGYPGRLQGSEQIPLEARIVGLTDAFDAMTSDRPYRKGMPVDRALAIIRDNLGRQFDAPLGERFIALGEQGLLDHVVGHSDAGIPLQACGMCQGQVIVLRKGQRAGAKVYCRACGSEGRVEQDGTGFTVLPTGQQGSAAQLEPDVDEELVDRLIDEASRHLGWQPVSRGPLGWWRGVFGGG